MYKKNKRRIAIVLVMLMVFGILPTPFSDGSNIAYASGGFSGGDGSQGNPYQVSSAAQLNEIRNFSTGHFVLTSDIDMTGVAWTPIPNFSGTIDGNYYKIANLTNSTNDPFSFIVNLNSGGVIKNISFEDVNILSTSYNGNLSAIAITVNEGATISSCIVTGSITLNNSGSNYGYIGGIAVINKGAVEKCYVDMALTASNRSNGHIGGIVASLDSSSNTSAASISECWTKGSIVGTVYLGGISGYDKGKNDGSLDSTIDNCLSEMSISVSNQRGAGISGQVYNTDITKCLATGSVSGTTFSVGGLFGLYHNSSTDVSCFFDTETTLQTQATTNGVTTGSTGETTANLMKQATFTDWDFTNIWEITEDTTYPQLKWYSAWQVSRATRPSSDATLASLTISTGTLSPAFDSSTNAYTSTVSNDIVGITVTPTTADGNATITVNGVAVNSGESSGNIDLNVGTNTITTIVTAEDGISTKTYSIVVTREAPLSSECNLSSLALNNGTLSPTFDSNTNAYTSTVSYGVLGITVTPTSVDGNATITVNGVAVNSGESSGNIGLNVGTNTITINVTAEDSVTSKIYTIEVTRAVASSESTLSNLALNNGTLSPSFDSNTNAYTSTVSNDIAGITVTPISADGNATITVNGVAVNSGESSGNIGLNVGTNTITIIVTAEDGISTKTYSIVVTREAALSSDSALSNLILNHGTLSPAFDSSIYAYTSIVSNEISEITIRPISTTGASITVNGLTVNSGESSGNIGLNVGTNTITIIVTAEDGISTKTYSIVVTREAPLSSDSALSNLILNHGTLSPAFDSSIYAYTSIVSNEISEITIRPISTTGASITVNGLTVNSGESSGNIGLNVGTNTITIIVTAEDGISTKTYSIVVTREAALSSDCSLSSLTLNNGPLSPVFDSNTYAYTSAVSYSVSNITVTLESSNASSTILVNGISVNSGESSSNISLSVGVNVVRIIVTAEDGVSTKIYTITIIRGVPSNAGSSGNFSEVGAPPSNQTSVIVNGKTESAGTLVKAVENGKTTVMVSVSSAMIEGKIEEAVKNNSSGNRNIVQIFVSDKSVDDLNVELTGDIVKKLEDSTFDISIKKNAVEYIIPAEELTISNVAKELGVSWDALKDIKVEVQISELNTSIT